ncbi:MAG: response regulator [Rhodocyclaceae bacterium]
MDDMHFLSRLRNENEAFGELRETANEMPGHTESRETAVVVFRSGKDRRKGGSRDGSCFLVEAAEASGGGPGKTHGEPVPAELELRLAKQAAEAANRAKSEFLATMCHEIRNPVNVMVGMIDLALQSDLTAEQREYLMLMKTSSSSLLSVINESLDLARIEAGCLEAERIPFSLRECLGDAVKMLAFEAQRKGLVLAYDIAQELPDAVQGDPMRLRQIIVNLLGNAIKFTGQGDVVLSVECEGINDDEVICRFAIADSGPGIPDDRQAAIFEPFLQADASTARRFGGSGLGLAISARLVSMMGGKIWLESTPGIGSTFFFTARFGRQKVLPGQCEAVDYSGLRALVVEDHPVSRRFLVNTLRCWHIDVDVAASGKSALALIEQADSAQVPYRLLLLADRLRSADNHAVIEKLRTVPGGSPVKLVRLASCTGRKNGAGYPVEDGGVCLTMPVKQSELLGIVSSLACHPAEEGRRIGTRGEPVGNMPAEKGKPEQAILVVDDDPLNSRLSQLVLEKAGCRVLVADGAAETLEILAREHIDLVLMDVQMPKVDGIETARMIRRQERLSGRRVPVIALSAGVVAQEREACLQAGMDGYLSKPIRPENMPEINTWLQVAAAAAQAESVQYGDQVLDRRALLLAVSGDRRLLAEIIVLFMDNCRKLMIRGHDAIDKGDQAAFSRTLHTLLGMFQSLSASSAQAVVARLRGLSIEQVPDQVAAIHAQLDREVKILEAALLRLKRETHNRHRRSKE